MGRRLQRRLHQFVHDVFGRSPVGIAHPEVDDVFAVAPSVALHRVGNVEDIRRQPLNPAELFHGDSRIQGARE